MRRRPVNVEFLRSTNTSATLEGLLLVGNVMNISFQIPGKPPRTQAVLLNMDPDEIDLDLTAELVRHIMSTKDEGAILVFLPGWEQISNSPRCWKVIGCSTQGILSVFRYIPSCRP